MSLLKKETNGRGKIDVVIDSAGGDQLMAQVAKVLKGGGKVICYGMWVLDTGVEPVADAMALWYCLTGLQVGRSL